MTTVRRLAEADCQKLHDFLAVLVVEDPASGMVEAHDKDFLEAQVKDGIRSWVALDGTKLVGILGPEGRGEREVDGKARTFCLFCRLAVDHTLYTTSQADAVAISKALTLAAADDIQASDPPDDIRVIGPANSRGASWCRNYLKMTETKMGGTSEFICPFEEIWDRCKVIP